MLPRSARGPGASAPTGHGRFSRCLTHSPVRRVLAPLSPAHNTHSTPLGRYHRLRAPHAPQESGEQVPTGHCVGVQGASPPRPRTRISRAQHTQRTDSPALGRHHRLLWRARHRRACFWATSPRRSPSSPCAELPVVSAGCVCGRCFFVLQGFPTFFCFHYGVPLFQYKPAKETRVE